MVKQFLPDTVTGYALDKTNFGEFAFIVPEESTNLIPSPSMDKINGYTAVNSTIAIVTNEQKFGYRSLSSTKTGAGDFGVSRAINLTASASYTYSVYAKAKKATVLWIEVRITAGGVLVSRKMYQANGNWQRMILTFGTPVGTTSYTIRVISSYSTTGIFYTDGWQLENKPYATTFICGDTLIMRNLDNPSAYRWNGNFFNSSSTRTSYTRDGGRIVTLSDLGIFLTSVGGLGFRGVKNNITTLNDGSGFFEGSVNTQRQFTIVLTIYGKSYNDVVSKNTLLRQCIYSETSGGKEYNKLMFFQYDEYGQPAKEFDIRCYFSGSVETEINNIYQKKIALTYEMPVPGIIETGNDVADLYYKTDFQVNYIAKMGSDGSWSNLDSGFNGIVYDILETPDGNIWACGSFTTANGVQCRRLAYWDGSIWTEACAITAGTIYCLETDGINIWAGGNVTYSGSTAYLLRINLTTLAVSTTWATSCNGDVLGMYYDFPKDYLYVCGSFTQGAGFTQAMGGTGIFVIANVNLKFGAVSLTAQMWGLSATSTCIRSLCKGSDGNLYATGSFDGINYGGGRTPISVTDLAMYNMTTANWVSIGNLAGTNHAGRVIKLGPDGNIYVGGTFSSVGGVSSSCLAKRIGGSWQRLINNTIESYSTYSGGDIGITSGDPSVYDIHWDSYGVLYFVGYFDIIGGYPTQESIASFVSNSFMPSTIDTGVSIAETIRAITLSRYNEIYIGTSTSSSGHVCGEIVKAIQEDVYPIFIMVGPGRLESIINRSNGKSVWFRDLYASTGEVIIIYFSNSGITYSTNGRDISTSVLGGSDVDFKLSKGSNKIDVTIFYGDDGSNTKAYLILDRIYDGIEAISNVSL